MDKIAHILKKHKVFATFNPLNTMRSSLRCVKDRVNPKDMKGVYSLPCSCGIPYIGETGRSINLCFQEHAADLGRGIHVPHLLLSMHKKLCIMCALRTLRSSLGLITFIIGNYVRPLKLKSVQGISIRMMARP